MFEDENGDFWIAKFNVPNDPYDMAIAEHTVLEMGRDMGLKVAESKVLQLPSGENVFLSKRFDRQNNEKFHSLSLYSLVPSTEIIKRNPFAPGNPSSFIQTLIRRYSDFANIDTLNIVTKMLLDIAVNNTDNHLRNLRIILNKNNKWELSPIFDVVPNPFNQNHTYNPAGLPLNQLYLNNPLLASSMSRELKISSDIIQEKIDLVKSVSSNWEFYCDKNGMTEEDKIKIGNAIHLGLHRKEYNNNLKVKNQLEKKFIFVPPKLKPHNINIFNN
jgi:serine/threonine-protein kinase HipA